MYILIDLLNRQKEQEELVLPKNDMSLSNHGYHYGVLSLNYG